MRATGLLPHRAGAVKGIKNYNSYLTMIDNHNRKSNQKRVKSKQKRLSKYRIMLRWVAKKPWPLALVIIATLFTVVGGINDVIEFVQRWPSDNGVILLVVAGLVYVVLFVILVYVVVTHKKGSTRLPARVAWIGLIVLSVVALVAWTYADFQNRALDEKTIVLVANYDGPDPQNYRVTEQIIKQLQQTLRIYDDTLVIALNEPISEQDGGSTRAQTIGRQYHADIVLWGWYGVTATDVLVTIHVENLTRAQTLPLSVSTSYSPQVVIQELDNFSLQERLSDEMAALVIFLKGVIRYEAKDFNTAYEMFTESLQPGEWPNALIDESHIYGYRGTSSLYLGKYQQAIENYSQAIQLNSAGAAAYYGNRGMVYSLFLNEMQKGVDDLTEALRLDPQNAALYNNRGTAYLMQGKAQDSMEDLGRAIQLEPTFVYAYFNRGQAYTLARDHQHAIDNFTYALQLDNNFPLAYQGRCTANLFMKQNDQAIADCDRFLELYKPGLVIDGQQLNFIIAITYNNRGLAYFNKGVYDRAIADLTESVRIMPELKMAYVNRGHAYAASGETANAIEDFSTALEINTSDPALANFRMLDPAGEVMVDSTLYFNRALLYIASGGRRADAIADLQKVIEITNSPSWRDMAIQRLKNLGVNPEQ